MTGKNSEPLDKAVGMLEESSIDLVALDSALNGLGKIEPRIAQVVELRFFAGLSMEKIARLLDVPLRTLERDWRMARIWLFRRLSHGKQNGSGSVAED